MIHYLKKNLFFLTLTTSFFILLLTSCRTPKTSFHWYDVSEHDLEQMQLKGPVKSIEKLEYIVSHRNGKKQKKRSGIYATSSGVGKIYTEFNRNGDIIKRIAYSLLDGNVYRKSTYKYAYNEVGKRIQKMEFDPLSITMSNEYVSKITYQYDNTGKLVKKSKYQYDTQTNWIYTYNAKGKLTQKRSENFKTTYTYNDKGNLIKEKWYKKGKLALKTTYTYRDDHITLKYYENGRLSAETVYDANGENITTNKRYRSTGEIKYRWTYKYNSQQDVIEKKMYGAIGDPFYTKVYKYTYDKRGNWIKKKRFRREKLKHIIVRKITYFDK